MINVHTPTDTVENADAEAGEEGLDLWASLTQDMTPEEKKTYERLCSEKPEMAQKWLDTDTSMFKGMDLGLPEEKGKEVKKKAEPTKNAANQQPNVENPPEVDEKLLNELWDRLGLNPTTLVDNCGGKGGKPGPCPHTHTVSFKNEKAFKDSEEVFGRKLEHDDYLKMMGIHQLDGYSVKVQVRSFTAKEGKPGEHKVITLDGHDNGISITRKFHRDPSGNLVCTNDSFVLDKTGGGVGTKVFHDQVTELVKVGVDRIETLASKGEGMNGYYTWPLLGYDGDLKQGTKTPSSLSGAKRLSDVMKTQEGRDWWKTNGEGVDVTFDLKPGSLSRKILSEYVSKKFGI